MLNQVAVLEVDDTVKLGKDSSEESGIADPDLRKPQVGKLGKPTITQSETIRNESDLRDSGNIRSDSPKPSVIRPNISQNDVSREDLSFHDDLEIGKGLSAEERKRIAKENLDTLASLMAKHYRFDPEDAIDIIKQVDSWEEKLCECSTEGNPTELYQLNEDLRNFLLDNRGTIQPLIDQATRDKA